MYHLEPAGGNKRQWTSSGSAHEPSIELSVKTRAWSRMSKGSDAKPARSGDGSCSGKERAARPERQSPCSVQIWRWRGSQGHESVVHVHHGSDRVRVGAVSAVGSPGLQRA